MNNDEKDEKKSVVPEGGVDNSTKETERKDGVSDLEFGDSADTKEEDADIKDATDAPDHTGSDEDSVDKSREDVFDEDSKEDVPQEGALEDSELDDGAGVVSEEERELGRIEGIDSIGEPAKVEEDEPKDDTPARDARDDAMTAPVDLEKSVSSGNSTDATESPLVLAMRHQEQTKAKTAHSKTGLIATLLGILLLVAIGGAGYFYWQSNDSASKLATAQSDLTTMQSQNATLSAQLAKSKSDAQATATNKNDGTYKAIPELGVRFKPTDATKDIVFGYTTAPDAAAADAVALSTKQLVKLAVPNGAAATYPCGFGGNVPIISSYTTDAKVGDSTASKLGKKIGSLYYVYTAPTGNCAPTELSAQAARTTAAKAVYDALEALPATTTQSAASTTQNSPSKQ